MSTRVCVKGLPKAADDAVLRAHFAARSGAGAVTDARVLRTRDGASRCFGFVGFRDAAAAEDAVRYFDRSFLGAARLSVEPAQPVGSEALARPWSNAGRMALAIASEGGGGGEGTGAPTSTPSVRGRRTFDDPDDPRFAEFVALHAPRAAVPLWVNDEGAAPAGRAAAKPAAREAAAAPKAAAADADGGAGSSDDDDLYEDAPGGAADGGDEAGTPPPPDAVVVDAAVSDADYLKARTVATFSDDEEEEEKDEGSDAGTDSAAAAAAAADAAALATPLPLPPPRPIVHAPAGHDASDGDPPTARLFIRNLPFSATAADIEAALSPHGAVLDTHIVLDRVSRGSKGIAFATMASVEDAVAALTALDNSIFQGRLLHVLPGKAAPVKEGPRAADAGDRGSGDFRAARDAARRAGAGGAADRAAWNALFVRPDTVAEAVAAHFGVTKGELLDRHAADAPVRLALGEAHVLAATKAALAEAGVDVAALEEAAVASGGRKGHGARGAATPLAPPSARHPTTLLVKNLPYATTEADLATLFGAHGRLARLALPPSRGLALVEFGDATAAKAALASLAYRRLHHVPLYLEWAPVGVWARAADGKGVAVPREGGAVAAAEPAPAKKAAAAAAAADLDAGATDGATTGTSLFVKNLSFATDDAELLAHFRSLARHRGLAASSVRSARVARRPRPAGAPAAGPAPSAGFGFVEAATEDDAAALLAAASAPTAPALGGHALAIARASAPKQSTASGAGLGAPGDARTKLIVRNVAFQAARSDLVALLSPFGAVRSCRLPKKASLDGAHRGYAFVDFASPAEAAAALAGVAGAHLYGRRLVAEWADADDESMDALTARAAARSRAEGGGGGKRAKQG